MFGVCANEYSPSDGKVVSFDHGCGAHSEALVPKASTQRVEPAEPPLDPLYPDAASSDDS
jgi:hypothetical protein